MKIVIGSDHAGFELKEILKSWLTEQGHKVHDVGVHSAERADYPAFGAAVGEAVVSGEADAGVTVCGSGQGISMAANKVPGVRAAIIRNADDARMTREHNDANVASFGERITDPQTAIAALEVFLATPFEGGRHATRVAQLDEMG